MNELVMLKKQNKQEIPVTTSKVMAEGSNNTHRAVYLLIDKYENDFRELGVLSFEMTKLDNEKGGRPEKIYYLNEDQALLLITYLRNNDIVRALKIALIKEFRAMKDFIQERHSEEWKESRLQGKCFAKQLNDEIKVFVEYAISQGSNSPNNYYNLFARLCNKAVGVDNGCRELAHTRQLMIQTFVMDIVKSTISEGMGQSMPYKEVYKLCKERVEEITQRSYLKIAQ